jgi:NADPH:quinone reductase-like Zn-dependent oxidoreductase
MRALRFARHGDPDVLSVESVPVPVPGRGEVLVEVHAAAVNPSDVKNVAGAMRQTTLPRTPGRDFAGRVVGGAGLPLGTEVFGTSGRLGFMADGTHAEYVVVPLRIAIAKPRSIPMAAAAAAGVPIVTALEGLRRAGLRAGESVLVVGGTGAVGGAAVQLARWRRAKVAFTSRRPPAPGTFPGDVSYLPAIDAEARARAGAPAWFDVVFNTVGGETFASSLAALAPGGRLVAIASPPDAAVSLDLRDFYRRDLHLIGLDSLKLPEDVQAEHLSEAIRGLQSGAIALPAPVAVPLEGAREAYRETLRGGGRKHVLVMR